MWKCLLQKYYCKFVFSISAFLKAPALDACFAFVELLGVKVGAVSGGTVMLEECREWFECGFLVCVSTQKISLI